MPYEVAHPDMDKMKESVLQKSCFMVPSRFDR
jgi:hypothetical protein